MFELSTSSHGFAVSIEVNDFNFVGTQDQQRANKYYILSF